MKNKSVNHFEAAYCSKLLREMVSFYTMTEIGNPYINIEGKSEHILGPWFDNAHPDIHIFMLDLNDWVRNEIYVERTKLYDANAI